MPFPAVVRRQAASGRCWPAGVPLLTPVLVLALAACASGGGSPPLTGAEAEAIFAGLTGVWVLDDSSSSARMPKIEFQREKIEVSAESVEQARREAARMSEELARRGTADLEAILEVFSQRPSTLILRVDEDRLAYVPAPGQSLEMPMSGEWIWQDPERQSVRTRVYWDGDRLALERRARSSGQVRAVLEIVDGRLRITRRIRVPRMSAPAPPFVLVYDRDEGRE